MLKPRAISRVRHLRGRFGWREVVLGVAGLAFLGGFAGNWWVHRTLMPAVNRRLAQVERQVEESLRRPVEGGQVERLLPWGLRIGQVRLPPTDWNASTVTVDAITLGLDWRALIFHQTLKPNVTLVRPHLTWVQDEIGFENPLPPVSAAPKPSQSWSGMGTVRIRHGTVTFNPKSMDMEAGVPRTTVSIERLNGHIRFQAAPQQWTLGMTGQVDDGRFRLDGQGNLDAASQMTLTLDAFSLASLNLVLPSTIGIQNGILDGQLSAAIATAPTGTPHWDTLNLQGRLNLQSDSIKLGRLADPLTVQSFVTLQGQQITLNNAQLQLGPLALRAAGTIDRQQGYDLTLEVPPTRVEESPTLTALNLPWADQQTVQVQAQVTGSLAEPHLDVLSAQGLAFEAHAPGVPPGTVALALGMEMLGLPRRESISLIEGAHYTFRETGAWFILRDGTVIPPLSEQAYWQAVAQASSDIRPAFDTKLLWFLQTNPFVTAIAADLEKGRLRQYVEGQVFNTDRFFLEDFMPIYLASSLAAGLDPGESLWMLDHALRTLQDPLLRAPDATPIVSGSGQVGSFWADEQALSMAQLVARPYLAQEDLLGNLARLAVVQQIQRKKQEQSPAERDPGLASTPEVMSKIPNVTYGAEEGAIAHALGILQFQGAGIYADKIISLAQEIRQNEAEKQALREGITDKLRKLSTDQTQVLGNVLTYLSNADWDAMGLDAHLSPDAAAMLNGTNTVSVLVSRYEKAGYPLAEAYQNSRALLLELLRDRQQLPQPDRLIFALLKDYAFRPDFWRILAQKRPRLAPQFDAIAADVQAYRQLAQQGAALHESLYGAMIQEGQDIGVHATIKQAIGFQAHLARLIDQAFLPADAGDSRYRAFRRSLAIYLRESPDISVYGGTQASLRLFGQETLNVQELIAVDPAAAPRIRAFARLYQTARAANLIGEWDVAGFQRILLAGALLAAGVDQNDLPPQIASVGFPHEQFRRDLLFVVGPEGIKVEATRLGIQAHDFRVPFQPVTLPDYHRPSFDVMDPNACPTEPSIQAIALGPGTQFVWDPALQQVVLRRGGVDCPLNEQWSTLFFDTLLTSVPVIHSEAGAKQLQDWLRQAQLLEVGVF